MKNIQKIQVKRPKEIKKKRVCAYARISKNTDRLHNSLHQQISYYKDFINSNLEWDLVGIYIDEGISGTRTKHREEFNKMVKDCEDGKIDIILTKSISRFARNTVDLLETIRYLKNKSIEVRFEKEGINTFTSDGEIMLSILASFAQEESTNMSENIKWAVRKGYEKGECKPYNIYGYKWNGKEYEIVKEEAKIVKFIFRKYLEGYSTDKISKMLNNKKFGKYAILNLLSKEQYTGDTILQKTYTVDPLKKTRLKNRGELPKYYVENTHPKIIEKEDFDKVQFYIKNRINFSSKNKLKNICFNSKIKCVECNVKYHVSYVNKQRKRVYTCSKRKAGLSSCEKILLHEDYLKELVEKEINKEFSEEEFNKNIEIIEVFNKEKIKVKRYKWVE